MPKGLSIPILHHDQHHQEDDTYIARRHIAEHNEAHAISDPHKEDETCNHAHETTHTTESWNVSQIHIALNEPECRCHRQDRDGLGEQVNVPHTHALKQEQIREQRQGENTWNTGQIHQYRIHRAPRLLIAPTLSKIGDKHGDKWRKYEKRKRQNRMRRQVIEELGKRHNSC